VDVQLTQLFKKKKETNPEKIQKDLLKKHLNFQNKESVLLKSQEALTLKHQIRRISEAFNLNVQNVDFKFKPYLGTPSSSSGSRPTSARRRSSKTYLISKR